MFFDVVVLIVGGGLGVVMMAVVMLYLTLMFWLIIQNFSFDFHVVSPSGRLGPSDAGAFITASGALGQGLAKSPDIPALFEPGTCVSRPGESGEGDGGDLQSLALGSSGDSLRRSDGLSDVLAILGRSADEIFPSNRVFMKCSKCGGGIPRFEGYRHIRIGDKKTFCLACQEAMWASPNWWTREMSSKYTDTGEAR